MEDGVSRRSGPGRSVIVVVGIDRYTNWPRLGNAVNDARGVLSLFRQLKFQEVAPPLLDEAATAEAMRSLVTDELTRLSINDNLVLFFAGHGHTHKITIGDAIVKTGYVIPVNGAPVSGPFSTWIRLDNWLSDIARLPARHILVILDACHSGIALGALIKWRDTVTSELPIGELQRRVSRRVITSALDSERAMDGGPYPQHSLFTGCFIEGLRGGLARDGRRVATGTEIGLYIQNRVRSYPASTQTPDFGALELDDRGEMVVPLLLTGSSDERTAVAGIISGLGEATLTDEDRPPVTHSAEPLRTRPKSLWSHGRRWTLWGVAAIASALAVLTLTHFDDASQKRAIVAPSAHDQSPTTPGARSMDASVGVRTEFGHDASQLDKNALVTKHTQPNEFVDTGHGVSFQSHQVTRGEYAAYLASQDDVRRASAIPRFDWDDTRGNAPVAWITFGQAMRYCAALGARLPTLKEWTSASGTAWWLDPADTGVRGPLREWTSTVDAVKGLARVAGGIETDPTQDLWIRLATPAEERRHEQRTPAHDAVSNGKVGVRCAK